MGSGHKTLLYGNAILLRHANSNMVRNLNFIITIFISNCESLVTLLDQNISVVRNHVKLLHVYKSRRGFSKGTVLCGGY